MSPKCMALDSSPCWAFFWHSVSSCVVLCRGGRIDYIYIVLNCNCSRPCENLCHLTKVVFVSRFLCLLYGSLQEFLTSHFSWRSTLTKPLISAWNTGPMIGFPRLTAPRGFSQLESYRFSWWVYYIPELCVDFGLSENRTTTTSLTRYNLRF